MYTTAGKVIVYMGLAALALMACGGEGTTDGYKLASTGAGGAGGAGGTGGESATSGANGGAGGTSGAAGGTNGAAGAGGQGGAMQPMDVEVVSCLQFDHQGFIYESPMDGLYYPPELTLKVGEVLRFDPGTDGMNMISGTPDMKPDGDGKFWTHTGFKTCLLFHVAGDYPFFCYSVPYATGVIHIVE